MSTGNAIASASYILVNDSPDGGFYAVKKESAMCEGLDARTLVAGPNLPAHIPEAGSFEVGTKQASDNSFH